MEEKCVWIAMSYSLPASPSSSRVYVWRKLRELGAQLRQGLALLPPGRANQQRLQTLAAKIRGMGGEAMVAELRFVDEQDDRRMVESFKQQSKKEYVELLDELVQLCDKSGGEVSRTIKNRLAAARGRDYFGAGRELEGASKEDSLLHGLELNLDGGFAELMRDLKQGYRDLGNLISQGGNQGK